MIDAKWQILKAELKAKVESLNRGAESADQRAKDYKNDPTYANHLIADNKDMAKALRIRAIHFDSVLEMIKKIEETAG